MSGIGRNFFKCYDGKCAAKFLQNFNNLQEKVWISKYNPCMNQPNVKPHYTHESVDVVKI